jgi:hypothetical protein
MDPGSRETIRAPPASSFRIARDVGGIGLRALPTRGLLYAAVLILLVLTVAVVALWMRLTDAEAIRTAIGARLEEALGERVELGMGWLEARAAELAD